MSIDTSNMAQHTMAGWADGWRPIDTAPKDGTHILLTQGRDVAEGFWNTNPNATRMPPYWATYRIIGKYGEQPSHWMPLPKAPEPA